MSDNVVHLSGDNVGTKGPNTLGLEIAITEAINKHANEHAIPIVSVIGVLELIKSKQTDLMKDED